MEKEALTVKSTARREVTSRIGSLVFRQRLPRGVNTARSPHDKDLLRDGRRLGIVYGNLVNRLTKAKTKSKDLPTRAA